MGTHIDAIQLITLFNAMADAMDQEKSHLCELDGAIGDADHGVTMSLGFSAVRQALAELNTSQSTPTDVFNTAAKSFLSAVGASAGPLYATAFMRAAASCKGLESLDTDAFANCITAMAEGIQTRGKANAGDKTMLDAWEPAALAATNSTSNTCVKDMLSDVASAAEAGADATIDMQAKMGRAAKLGERSIGHKDAGAASTALLLRAMADALS